MISIYGTGEDISYEEIGAVELLRSQGVPIQYLLSEEEGEVGRHSAQSVLSRFGVDVKLLKAGVIKNSAAILSFGRPKFFDLLYKSGERPGRVYYKIPDLIPTPLEVKAVAKGLVDEVFVGSPKRASKTVRELVKKANKGVEFRQGYVPFCNPDSDFCKFYFSERKSPNEFVVFRDTPDRPEYAFPDYWGAVASITAPMELKKSFRALGWGRSLTKVAGSPLGQNFFGREIAADLYEPHPPLEGIAEHYADASVLFHFFPADDVFSFEVVRAMLTGVVVVGPPLPAFSDLLQHGETGFMARSPDEAVYYASQVAWEPQLRIDVASKAYNWAVTKGPGNPDNCLPWWEPILRQCR